MGDWTYGNMDPCTLVHFNSQQVLTKAVHCKFESFLSTACVRPEKLNVDQYAHVAITGNI